VFGWIAMLKYEMNEYAWLRGCISCGGWTWMILGITWTWSGLLSKWHGYGMIEDLGCLLEIWFVCG